MTPDQATVGTRVRSTRHFVNVPKGTEGVIVSAYGGGVMVGWHLPDTEGALPVNWRDYADRPAIQCPFLRDGFDEKRELHWLEVVL